VAGRCSRDVSDTLSANPGGRRGVVNGSWPTVFGAGAKPPENWDPGPIPAAPCGVARTSEAIVEAPAAASICCTVSVGAWPCGFWLCGLNGWPLCIVKVAAVTGVVLA
jgi:hypothetical protein